MELALELITVLAASLFAGGALYVTVVEHPARVEAGVEAALAQFAPSYRRAARWQGGAAAAGLVAGIAATAAGGGWAWAISGALLGVAIPLTLLAIAPINRQLTGSGRPSEPVAQELLRRWGRLHALRSLSGFAALLVAAAQALA